MVFEPETAARLNAIWDSFIQEHYDQLTDKADSPAQYNDKIFWDNSAR